MSTTLEAAEIRPFTFEITDADLEDLRTRITAARFAEKETVDDHSQGTPLATVRALAKYWAEEYDWRNIEARLRSFPNYVTEIDGVDIHFLHLRSKHSDALPLIVTHGWPGSVMSMLKVVEALTDPTAHGGTASEAFHLVLPSIPGFGFSGKPTDKGWGPEHIAHAWAELMKRLGYNRYVAQGGDWGAIITEQLAVQAPPELAGIHTNMPGAVPADIDAAVQTGGPAPVNLSEEEQRVWEQLEYVFSHIDYALMMGSRPQSLAGLVDSPIGLAAFLLDLEPDAKSQAMISRAFEGKPEALTRDDVLDNVTLFWLTKSGVSAARLYGENTVSFFKAKGIAVPVAVSIFPDEFFQTPRGWAERAYPNLVYFNEAARGGHFPAWEQPDLFVDELRNGFQPMRWSGPSSAPS